MVVIGVEDDLQIVGAEIGVPAREHGADAARTGVLQHARADVQRRAVEREPHLGALGGGLPFVRLILAEIGGRRRRMPDRLVELAVEVDLLAQRNRARVRRGGRMDVLRY